MIIFFNVDALWKGRTSLWKSMKKNSMEAMMMTKENEKEEWKIKNEQGKIVSLVDVIFWVNEWESRAAGWSG
jgi:hypothetical protein